MRTRPPRGSRCGREGTRGGSAGAPVSCSVDIGRAAYEAQAHAGVGGPGTAGCSGDLLLGALAACAQITCQMVAAAMGIPAREIRVVRRGRPRPARHPRAVAGGRRRLRADPRALRPGCPRRDGGTARRAAGQDGAVLRRHADAGATRRPSGSTGPSASAGRAPPAEIATSAAYGAFGPACVDRSGRVLTICRALC